MSSLQVGDLTITLTRKNIKNLHLRVYPPDGAIKISAPRCLTDAEICAFVLAKRSWIEKQQAKLNCQPTPATKHYLAGEQHPFRGRWYPLEMLNPSGQTLRKPYICLTPTTIALHIDPKSNLEQRADLLQRWYRAQLKTLIPPLIAEWQPRLGVEVRQWRIKRMKTRWGTCNIAARRIWLNLELIKYGDRALEYVVVHEMIHLLERGHNARFYGLLDQFLPDWRSGEQLLKRAIV
ncbi:MAG: SprT family zinc-dependent metalloprotease [Cyanobacteria bacterium P01_G01_bin.54]